MADDQQDKNTSQQSGMHVLAKPIGPVCDIKCDYCFYLEKRALFGSGEQYRMPDEVLSSYIRQYVESQPTSVVEFVWHGGEPTLLGVDFFRRRRWVALGVVEFRQRAGGQVGGR